MAANGQTGNTSTFTISGSTGWTPAITAIGGLEETREALEDTVLSTTSGKKTYTPDDLVDNGPITITYWFDQSTGTRAPISAVPTTAAGTGTLTYPLKTGESTAATLTGTGFITRRQQPELVNGSLMVGEADWMFDGKTGPTLTAGS